MWCTFEYYVGINELKWQLNCCLKKTANFHCTVRKFEHFTKRQDTETCMLSSLTYLLLAEDAGASSGDELCNSGDDLEDTDVKGKCQAFTIYH